MASGDQKIVFKSKGLLGNNLHKSSAMEAVIESDTHHTVFNRDDRTREVFHDLKEMGKDNVRKGELVEKLADYKYKKHYDPRGIDAIAKNLGLGKIEKSDCSRTAPKTDLSHHSGVSSHEMGAESSKKMTGMGSQMGRGTAPKLGGGGIAGRFLGGIGR